MNLAASSIKQSLRWDLFFTSMPILTVVLTFVIACLLGYWWNKRHHVDFMIGPKELGASDWSLQQFYSWVPVILGIHLAIALLINGFQGKLLAWDNMLQGAVANWFGLLEILIALSLFYGGFARVSAVLIAFLWVMGFEFLGIKPMLETIQYLGFAAFFYLAGRGPYAIDRILFPKLEPTTIYSSYALMFLRIGVGLNIIVFAFTQKLANIPFGIYFLEQHSYLNFSTLPNESFLLFAGAFELLAGLLITFGIFPRLTIVLTLIGINASLTISNWNAFIDYLPTYGALAVLLIWDPYDPIQRLKWVESLRKNMPSTPIQ